MDGTTRLFAPDGTLFTGPPEIPSFRNPGSKEPTIVLISGACTALPWIYGDAQSIAAQEERVQRSIRRSQEPVVKRTGKPIMFRSQPIVRKKKVVDEGDKINPEDDVRRAAL